MKSINITNMVAIDNQTNPLLPEGQRAKFYHEYMDSVE
jgi:hypothetical protein